MTRTEIINHFIEKNNYQSYLEVGVHDGRNFDVINCKTKIGVDPDPTSKATIFQTSDDFFKESGYGLKFDCVFLDGLHTSIQLYKDIINSLNSLNDGGTIIIHDLLPTSENCQKVPRIQGEWTGDCWLAFTWIRATRPDLTMYVIDTDYGVGIIQKGQQEPIIIEQNLTYQNFEKNKKEWLNLRSEL